MLKKFVLGGMVVVAALLGNACGDDCSGDSPAGPADSEVSLSSSSDNAVSSSSEKNEAISSSYLSSSSSKKAVSRSSSSNEKSSSSSGKVESSSSGKGEKSSSSEGVAGSSSSDVVAGSSSSEKSSSSVAESSSSVESSSSEEPSSSSVVESSSSVVESISSGEDNVSSSSEYYKSSWTYLNKNITYDTIQMPELKQHSWCYKDKDDNCELYGRLYDLTATLGYDSTNTTPAEYLEYGKKDSSSIQGICPQGFILPTISDFEVLKNNYDPKQLVSSGTNSSGMSVVVKNMGYRNTYQEISYTSNKPAFWTATYEWASSKDGRVVYFRTANSEYYYDDNTSFNQSYAVSVRCLKKD